MGDDYPGLRSASTPGYPYSAPLGLKSRKKVAPFGRLRDRDSFATASELAELTVKLRGRDFFTVSELAELALLVAQGLSFLRKSTNLVQLGKS